MYCTFDAFQFYLSAISTRSRCLKPPSDIYFYQVAEFEFLHESKNAKCPYVMFELGLQ
jgi:hypothetical protein